jgi:hypothetical protein
LYAKKPFYINALNELKSINLLHELGPFYLFSIHQDLSIQLNKLQKAAQYALKQPDSSSSILIIIQIRSLPTSHVKNWSIFQKLISSTYLIPSREAYASKNPLFEINIVIQDWCGYDIWSHLPYRSTLIVVTKYDCGTPCETF